MYKNTDFRPTYYTLSDHDVFNRLFKNENVDLDDLSQKELFFNCFLRKKIKSPKALFFQMSWLTNWVYYGTDTFKYSDDIYYGIYDAYTVTNVAINIAQYMGAKEIILIGCDCSYLGKKHAGEENSSVAEFKTAFNEEYADLTQSCMIKGYKFMKEEMAKRNIKVYNATRGGCLEVFERVNLEDTL